MTGSINLFTSQRCRDVSITDPFGNRTYRLIRRGLLDYQQKLYHLRQRPRVPLDLFYPSVSGCCEVPGINSRSNVGKTLSRPHRTCSSFENGYIFESYASSRFCCEFLHTKLLEVGPGTRVASSLDSTFSFDRQSMVDSDPRASGVSIRGQPSIRYSKHAIRLAPVYPKRL
jgi:hypothetical protein